MSPFRIYILGCGSALPTLRHNPSSQVVEIRGKFFMVDCGEGTQTQLRRSRLRFSKLNNVFITHLHGDHCLGLVGMISTFGLLGRTTPLNVYAPEGLKSILEAQIDVFCHSIGFEVAFHVIDTTARSIIYEDRSVSVETIPLAHRVPCCGFLFREKPSHPHINRAMTDYYKVPISQFNNIKNGADWIDEDGKIIPNSVLTKPAAPPRSYAYCSDTSYMPELHEQLSNVTVLYHEATYMSSEESLAHDYFHSTAAEAAKVAAAAEVGKLILGHYSSRYEDETQLLNEAKALFPNSILADEGASIEI